MRHSDYSDKRSDLAAPYIGGRSTIPKIRSPLDGKIYEDRHDYMKSIAEAGARNGEKYVFAEEVSTPVKPTARIPTDVTKQCAKDAVERVRSEFNTRGAYQVVGEQSFDVPKRPWS